MRKSNSNPDQVTAERRRERKDVVEQRIIEVESWLISYPSTHPEWRKFVQELHALNIQLEQLVESKAFSGFEITPYRFITK